MPTAEPTSPASASVAAPGAATVLHRAAHRVSRRLEDAVRPPHGPGLDAWRVLDLLADGAGHPMSEIAAHAMVPAPTLTKIVDRLVDRGLVYRHADDGDRRRVLVLLARRGREQHTALAPAVAAVEHDLREALGPDADTVLAALARLG